MQRALIFAALALFAAGSPALIVRVESTNGTPRLLVDGVPTRPSMFYGAPGASPLSIGLETTNVTFTFVASASATNGTLHFRFGAQPGEVWLDHVTVTDLTASNAAFTSDFEPPVATDKYVDEFKRHWLAWPQGAANTVATQKVETVGTNSLLHVTLRAPADGKWPDYHIYSRPIAITKGHQYQVAFTARASGKRDLLVALYRPGERFVRIGGPPDCFAEQIRLAAEAGVDFVTFPIGLPWPKPGAAADWSEVDESCAYVLRANPRALLIPRIPMDPPRWWREAHPDDCMQWEDGRRDKMAVCSATYQRDASERLSALVAHLESAFGDHVAGYHPCGQNTGEWFYEDTWKKPLSGYSPAELAAWRSWLSKKYPNESDLQSAWWDANVTPATAAVPDASQRHSATNGVFRSAVRERALIEWAEFQQEAMADGVTNLAHAVRTASGGRKLVMFFYGYLFEFAAVDNGPATSGHYALERVLRSPDIDVLCSPISYFDRGLGGGAPSMTAAESVALAGKMWLNEDDTHTYLASGTPPGWKEHVDTLAETVAELNRNLAQETMRHFANWWMDLGASGWFKDAAMWEQQTKLRDVTDQIRPLPAYRPEVALVIDERSMLHLAPGCTSVTRPGIYEARAAVSRMGAPFGQYLLRDVLNGKVNARLYIFLNAWRLSLSERSRLHGLMERAVSVWCYAPGWIGGDGSTSTGHMQQITDFTFTPVTAANALAQPTDQGRKLGLTKPLGILKRITPLFAVSNAAPDDVLARYEDGSAAVVMRQSEHRALFVGAPGLNSDLLRAAARLAKVHLFATNDCHVFANGPYVALHASADGPLALNTGQQGTVRDALTGEKIGSGPHVTVTLRKGETRILRIE